VLREQLGRGVLRRATMGIEDLVGWHDISKPKIGDLQQAAAREQHILGLQVAMGNADRVAVLYATENLPEEKTSLLEHSPKSFK